MITEILVDVLGQYTEKSKGNLAFHCPFCNHYKQKLEVHPELGAWACWICHTRGKSIKTLLRRLNVSDAIHKRYDAIVPSHKYYHDTSDIPKPISLPKDYKPLYIKSNSVYWKRAYQYATEERKLTNFDLLKYNIGYSESGKYSGMLIFPKYDTDGNLNFLTTRSYLGDKRFVNERISRNIVGFEMQLSYNIPLILTEGAIDAITVRFNGSPMYGSSMPNRLKMYILDNEISDVYLCLDPDALKMQIQYLKYLHIFGIKSYHVKIPTGYDINKLGYENSWNLINETKPISEGELFDLEVKMKMTV